MSDQTREKEQSLAELMVRILKEPLKPLDESVKGLGVELSDIKVEIEQVSAAVGECLGHSESAAKRSKDAYGLLETLRDEQAMWVGSIQASISEHAQDGAKASEAHRIENLKALSESEGLVLAAVATVHEAQIKVANTFETLSTQVSENRAALENALEQWRLGIAAANSDMSSSLHVAVVAITQQLEHQHSAAQAVHKALLDGMKSAADLTQEMMLKKQQSGQEFHYSLARHQAEIIAALNQHAESINDRLEQGQIKLRRLTITTGVFFTFMLACVGYELWSRIT